MSYINDNYYNNYNGQNNPNLSSLFVFGHSFVRRLDKYVRNRIPGGFSDLGEVSLRGFSGANVHRIMAETVDDNSLYLTLRDSHVLLQIGGNDLNSDGVSPVQLAREILNVARRLINEKRVRSVCICQLLYRRQSSASRFVLRRDYNRLVDEVNRELKFLCSFFPRIKFWSHKRMLVNWRMYLHKDGTHLNCHGQKKYYRSMRGAMTHMLNHY